MGHAIRSLSSVDEPPRRALHSLHPPRRRFALVLAFGLSAIPSCGEPPRPTSTHGPRRAETLARTLGSDERSPSAAGRTGCERIATFVDGREVETLCDHAAASRGLTILDLSDRFVPRVLDGAPDAEESERPSYRSIYVALADERWDELPEDVDPEPYLELFGISPTFRVLLARLGDEARHACHAAIDDADLLAMTGTLRTWTSTLAEQRARLRRLRVDASFFEQERERLGLPTLEQLEGRTARPGSLAAFLRDRTTVRAIEALQAHLVCDRVLEPHRYEPGVFDARTASALAVIQRKHVVVAAGAVDGPTRRALAADSREADFLAVLRSLRERIVDATGVIEDGSAANAWGTVLGRVLDPPEMRDASGREPLPEGAPDWVSAATEAAARALGWTSPEGFEAFVRSRGSLGRVAVALPERPRYHARHMELRAEIDRGDVWYDFPYGSDGRRRSQPVRRRPVLTLFSRDGDREVALVRWPTTIGGWKPERAPSGALGLRYKESPAGRRLWRDIVAAPAWLPPPSTPDAELVRLGSRGRFVANTDLFGPGYRSAYGLAMVVHHRVVPARGIDGTPTLYDEGIRVHGSVNYGSILRGSSHGCHRLYNHLAIRLAGFLLAHREHVSHGSMDVRYARRIRSPTGPVTLRITSRGSRYELTPPVEVEVLRGNVLGRAQEASDALRPLPRRASTDALAIL